MKTWQAVVLGALVASPWGGLQAASLVEPTATWRFLKGWGEASDPSTAWRAPDFEDGTWLTGQGPFFYDNGGGYSGNTQLTDMQGGYTCIFLRGTFVINNPASVLDLTLDLESDDGCIAWINGTEVARVNMPDGEPVYSDTSLGAAGDPNRVSVPLANPTTFLIPGANLLAIQAFNCWLADSSDFLISATLSSSVDSVPPTVVSVSPARGTIVRELSQVDILFSESVRGVDAADLRINGMPATGVTAFSPRNYVFTFPTQPAGVVAFEFVLAHGITDLAAVPNPFAGDSWTCTVDPTAPQATVILSEFVADNANGIRDDDGTRQDWIEVLNLGPGPADLRGWFLTDDPLDLTKWRFPSVTLEASAFLVVWASEKDRTNSAAPLHTNFKLAADGEYLALVDARTNIVSAFAPAFPPQYPDIAYGRDQGSPTSVGFFDPPTPGDPNSVSGAGVAPAPQFSRPGGAYPDAALTIALMAPAGTIHYTTDGTVPTEGSPTYTAPFSLTASAIVQARVFQPGLLPSPVVIRAYTLLDASSQAFNSNLPLLIVNTYGRSIAQDVPPGQPRTPATLTVIDTFRGRASLQASPQFQGRAQLEIRGQTSAGFPKRPYNLEINDAFGNDLDVALLDLPSESDWVLYNPYSDKPFLQNPLAFELHARMGHYAVRWRFVEVFVDTVRGRLSYPGDYQGIYVLMEKIKVDANRVDLARLTPYQNSEPEISGGYIVKKDKDSPGDLGFSTAGGAGFSGQYLKIHEPKPAEITPEQLNWIQDYLVRFEQALYAPDWLTRTGANHYSAFIDVDSFVDNHWIVEFSKQIDGYRLSNYLSKDRNGKLRMEPIWDWNLSFGNADYLDGYNTAGWYYPLIDENAHLWLRRLITGTTAASGPGDPDFNQRITDRWGVLRADIFAATNVVARIDELSATLTEAAARDFARWPRLNTYIWPNPSFYIAPTYAQILTAMKNWVRGRFTWIDARFTKAPVFSSPGGLLPTGFNLEMTAPAGSIFYLLDGSDPRAPGGALAAGARAYSGPVSLQANARVIARARNGSLWSPPTTALFIRARPPLTLTEIMYRPPAPPPGSTNDADAFEYLEFCNTGSQPLALAGFRLTRGVDFDFTGGRVATLLPGERVLVVSSTNAFFSRYGILDRVAGQFTGNLDNAGERLVFSGPVGEPVLDLNYNDAWYPLTDGAGFALVVRDETADPVAWANRLGWRAGSVVGGTPGQPEPPAPDLPPVRVNEILTHTDPPQHDSVELHNPTLASVDVGGWYLSDERDHPKFRLPAGTAIPAGGFLVLDSRQFNAVPGSTTNFSLSAAGDSIHLFSADATGRLTGYYDGFEYGAALNGVATAPHLSSTGKQDIVARESVTLGTGNAPPRIGPVVIGEVQYRPTEVWTNNAWWDNTEDEFIELVNVTSVALPLWDPLVPTSTWRLRDAIEYAFPTNTTLAPSERILVVSFNPDDAAAAASFRAHYGLAAGLRLFGPYEGRLANSSDSVELVQPDSLGLPPTNLVTAVLVDRVQYEDVAPWPAGADGLGFSLQRRTERAYGNDPTNWIAALPTPGAVLASASPPAISRQPASQSCTAGATVNFEVTATAQGPIRYQWRFEGENLPGATNAVLTLMNVQPAQAGMYHVVVLDTARATTSDPALLAVANSVRLLVTPQPVETPPGASVTFTVQAVSALPLAYQWRHDGSPLTGATGPSLQLSNVQPADSGAYDVVVSDATAAVTSPPAELTVLVPPLIVLQPVAQTNAVGGSVTFSVEITNTATRPLGYRWRRDGTTIAQHESWSPLSLLTLTNLALADAGNYSVVVTNRASYTPGVTSQNALLALLDGTDTDGDGLPDDYEDAHQFDPLDPLDAVADADGDGLCNLDEFRAGTDPRDVTSSLYIERVDPASPVILRFQAIANRTYSVQYCDQLEAGGWTILATVPAVSADPAARRPVDVIDPGPSSAQRYYRLVTPGLNP